MSEEQLRTGQPPAVRAWHAVVDAADQSLLARLLADLVPGVEWSSLIFFAIEWQRFVVCPHVPLVADFNFGDVEHCL